MLLKLFHTIPKPGSLEVVHLAPCAIGWLLLSFWFPDEVDPFIQMLSSILPLQNLSQKYISCSTNYTAFTCLSAVTFYYIDTCIDLFQKDL